MEGLVGWVCEEGKPAFRTPPVSLYVSKDFSHVPVSVFSLWVATLQSC